FTCTTVIPIGIKIRKLQSLRVIQYNIDVDKLTVVAIDQCPRSVPILIKRVFTGTMYIQFSGAVDLSCRSNPNTTAINMYLPVDLPVRIRTHIQSLGINKFVRIGSNMLQSVACLVRPRTRLGVSDQSQQQQRYNGY